MIFEGPRIDMRYPLLCFFLLQEFWLHLKTCLGIFVALAAEWVYLKPRNISSSLICVSKRQQGSLSFELLVVIYFSLK